MHSGPHDFASLLRPVSTSEFFNSYWECQPLMIQRGDAEFYEELLTDRDLEDIISTSDLRYPAIRLAKAGSYYLPNTYTTDITLGRLMFNGVPDVDRVSQEYGKGATISLPYLHRTWLPLGLLCRQLEEAFDYTAHANVYITPGDAAGFPPRVSGGGGGKMLEIMCARTAFRLADLVSCRDTEALLTVARALQSIGFLQVKRA
jgi:Cupin superfamily protein